jgi:hypothetical protein
MIKSKMIIWVICIRQNGNTYWVMARKREGERMLGRPRCRWENIKSFSSNRMEVTAYWHVFVNVRNEVSHSVK